MSTLETFRKVQQRLQRDREAQRARERARTDDLRRHVEVDAQLAAIDDQGLK